MSKKDYNFLDLADLPAGDYIEGELSLISDVKWAATRQFSDVARNHCGAVLVTNLALYYTQLGYDNLMIKDLDETFNAIHTIVGNGPQMFIAEKAKLYFSQRGYGLNHSPFRSFESLKQAIAENNPIAFLLCEGVFKWHWVMAVGWLQYESGELYIKIVTGWDSTALKYYKLGSGSCWWSATTYTIEQA